MADGADTFEASASALGYAYQVRRALLLCVEQLALGVDWAVAIEAADDIEIDFDRSRQLWQLKHRAPGVRMTNASPDLWKTLRIWAEGVKAGRLDLSTTDLFLLTTAELPKDSAGHLLRPQSEGGRDATKALKELERARKESTNKTNAMSYRAFDALSTLQKAQLLARVQVIGQAADIDGIKGVLRGQAVYAVGHAFADSFLQRLEGWFFQRSIQQLRSSETDLITGVEFDEEFTERRNQFRPDNLPVDFDVVAMEPDTTDYTDKVFVRQLELLELGGTRIRLAVRDYIRAFTQRSRWSDENLLAPGEIRKYERRLEEEWETRFAIMEDELGPTAAEDEKRRAAKSIYRWVEEQARVPIRAGCDESFITKGSYQMLADDRRVGWHPDFLARLMAILEPVGVRE